jgi:AcrR family transcriptional regulator
MAVERKRDGATKATKAAKATRDGAGPGRSVQPRTARGEDTRRALLASAARLFADKGYHATTVPEIVRGAGVGHGTFYEYFGSRRDILLALVEQAVAAGRRRPRLSSASLTERIRWEIYWYLADHVEHLDLSKIWHEAATFDPDIAVARRRERHRRVARIQRALELTGPRAGVDAAVAASALNAMLEEFAHRWFIEGDGPGLGADEVVRAAETITTLWLAAVGLDGHPPDVPVG